MQDYAVAILERGKCAWGSCYFCGWGKKYKETSIEDLKKKFLKVIQRKAHGIKIFSSGSFLDENQFPLEFVKWCIATAKEKGFKEIIFESRPEFITEEKLKEIKTDGIKITVAIGLEAANNEILLKYYNKGFTVEDYLRAVDLLRKHDFGVRTYVLVNGHPVLYKNQELQRKVLEKTIDLTMQTSDSIVIINAYPHKDSKLLLDWMNKEWFPLDKQQFYNLVLNVLKKYNTSQADDKKFIVKKDDKDILIELDFDNFNFIPRIPKDMQTFIKGVGKKVLLHPHFEIWQDFFVRFYKPPEEKIYALFLPCSFRKPYKRSKTHKSIIRAISGYPWFKKLHLIVVSTPGVVPWEFHDRYPFTHYDWPEWEETEEVKKDYIEITKERVKKYIESHKDHYKLYFAYFHLESETLEAIKQAFEELNLKGKLIEVLDNETYEKIKEEFGDKRIGSSVVRHPLAIKKLKEVVNNCLTV